MKLSCTCGRGKHHKYAACPLAIPGPAGAPDADLKQLVVPAVVWGQLMSWMAARGVWVFRMPDDNGDLPTYGLTFDFASGDAEELPR